jgi:hypothetical protein
MANTRVVSDLSGQAVLFTTPKHVKGKITALNIDNQGASSHTIILTDTFTPDASAGVASPTAQLKTRLQVTLVKGEVFSADEQSLRDIECLGVVGAVGDTLDSGCVIIANFHFE